MGTTSKSLRKGFIAGAALTVAATAGGAHAAGFYLEDQSTRASRRAVSGEAADKGAAAMF